MGDMISELNDITREIVKLRENLENVENQIKTLQQSLVPEEPLDHIEREKIIEFTHKSIHPSIILREMKGILDKTKHYVTVYVPEITDLFGLEVYEVRSSINIKAYCFYDLVLPNHNELIEEFDCFDNITIFLYNGKDRYVVLRDGEDLLFAIKGEKELNF